MNFNEDLLHFLWKSKFLIAKSLVTQQGEGLEILRLGYQNTHSGPDFEEAHLQIGNTHWVGAVEMHLKSSDWYGHQHQLDKAYENVILHVVYEHNRSVFRTDGSEIPVLELKELIPDALLQQYRQLMQSVAWIPCAALVPFVDPMIIFSEVQRSLLERLNLKSTRYFSLLAYCKGNWDEVFYISLASSMGFGVNALPFELLSKSLPQQVLAHYKNKSIQVEALLFGQAGFLDETLKEAYSLRLQNEYRFLKQKHALQAIDASLWKFFRLRPANFPTLRLAQFAALVQKSSHLFSKILEIEDPLQLRQLFIQLPIHEYWKTHYRMDAPSPSHSEQMGKQSIDSLLLNTVAGVLYAYGLYLNEEKYRLRAIDLLESLPAEKNQPIREFARLGILANHAAFSQGLLHLKKLKCDKKQCMNCLIGAKIMLLS